jgi:hypothetical protein
MSITTVPEVLPEALDPETEVEEDMEVEMTDMEEAMTDMVEVETDLEMEE